MMFPILPAHPGQRRVLRRLGRRQLRVALVLPFLSSTNLCARPVSRQECQTSCVTHSEQRCNTVLVDSCRLYCCMLTLFIIMFLPGMCPGKSVLMFRTLRRGRSRRKSARISRSPATMTLRSATPSASKSATMFLSRSARRSLRLWRSWFLPRSAMTCPVKCAGTRPSRCAWTNPRRSAMSTTVSRYCKVCNTVNDGECTKVPEKKCQVRSSLYGT